MPRVAKRRRKLKPALPKLFQPGFIDELDCRTLMARALRQRFESIAADLGGIDALSTIKASLIERFVFLEAVLLRMEAALANTDDAKASAEVVARWVQSVNAYQGLAKVLGVNTLAKDDPWKGLHNAPAPAASETVQGA